LKENDIDIGANIGSVGLKAASLCQNGKIYMIEANPETYKCIKKNIELNNFNNVLSFNVALGKEKAEIKFSNITADDMNRVALNNDDAIIVPLEKLDNILEDNIHNIDFLKIDVEEFEMDVFKGADKTLRKT
jgi:FkbM family methyltransferase